MTTIAYNHEKHSPQLQGLGGAMPCVAVAGYLFLETHLLWFKLRIIEFNFMHNKNNMRGVKNTTKIVVMIFFSQ